MTDYRDRVSQLLHRETDLEQTLLDLLDEYNATELHSLRNDFLKACYERIDEEASPFDRVKTHRNYTPNRPTKWQLATALRMLLTERVERPPSDAITSLDKQFLAEVIVAIRTKDTFDSSKSEMEASVNPRRSLEANPPPERTLPVDPHFDDGISVGDDTGKLETWVEAQLGETDDPHYVYVLDCTPPVEGENWRRKLLRRDAEQKRTNGQPLTDVNRAALLVTAGERIYYVGYTRDVLGRIEQHLSGAGSGGAGFLNQLPPRRLVEVKHYPTETAARRAEERRAKEVNRMTDAFAYFS